MTEYKKSKFNKTYEKVKKEGFPKPDTTFHPAYEKVKQDGFPKINKSKTKLLKQQYKD